MQSITLKTKFANTGAENLTVSRVSLGLGGFGKFDRIPENHALLDDYRALGGNLYDTARVYGTWLDEARTPYSEIILGKWLSSEERNAIISTKGAHPVIGSPTPRVTPECIRSDIADSLSNLCTKKIHIYFLHRDNAELPVAPIMDELNRHAEAGELNLLGASNWSAARIYQANDYCVKHGMRGFDVSQICFNIMMPTPALLGDMTLISMTDAEEALYRDMDMPVMAFTSQANGFVTRYVNSGEKNIPSRYATEDGMRRLDRIRTVMKETGLSGTEITMAYLNSASVTVIPIIGVSSREHLEDCIQAADSTVDIAYRNYIDGK